MSPAADAQTQRRERIRRASVLMLVLVSMSVGLLGFRARQSLITHFRPSDVTTVWIPALQMAVPAATRMNGEARAVPVLVYHGIQPVGSSCNVTPETFRQHMLALRSAGYTTLTMSQFEQFIAGRRAVPERSVLITFDDGRTDSFVGADPVLRKLGFHATMFTILGRAGSGKPFYLSEGETRMMAQTGRWDVESHTAQAHQYIRTGPMGGSGPALASRLWNSELGRLESDREYELRVTKDLTEAVEGLETLAGRRVTALAYPWGNFGGDSQDPVIRERLPKLVAAITPYSFAQAGPTIDETYNYPFDAGSVLRRVYISYDMTAENMMARLERGMPKALPFEDLAGFGSSGWSSSTGALAAGPVGGERWCTTASNGRAEVFLDGSRAWDDYAVRTQFSLQTSETVSVIARRAGPRDYLAATVGRRYVSIEQIVGDRATTLVEADVNVAADGTTLHDVVFSVRDGVAWLEIDGLEVVRAPGVDPALEHGGVGMRIDAPPGARAKLHPTVFAAYPLADEVASSTEPGGPSSLPSAHGAATTYQEQVQR